MIEKGHSIERALNQINSELQAIKYECDIFCKRKDVEILYSHLFRLQKLT